VRFLPFEQFVVASLTCGRVLARLLPFCPKMTCSATEEFESPRTTGEEPLLFSRLKGGEFCPFHFSHAIALVSLITIMALKTRCQ
jgi:hypothetical protein